MNSEPKKSNVASTKILIAEDMPNMSGAIKRILNQIGFELIIIAKNGEEALVKLDRHKQSTSPIQLIISDWKMEPISGIELLQRIKQNNSYKYLPFIMLTTESRIELVRQALKYGVTDYITKPFTANTLKDKFNRIALELFANGMKVLATLAPSEKLKALKKLRKKTRGIAPFSAEIAARVAMEMHALKEHDYAMHEIRDALALDWTNPYAQQVNKLILMDLKQLQPSSDYINQNLKDAAYSFDDHLKLGFAYIKEHNIDAAVRVFHSIKAKTNIPKYLAQTYCGLGMLNYMGFEKTKSTTMLQTAISHMETALKYDPELSLASFHLLKYYTEAGTGQFDIGKLKTANDAKSLQLAGSIFAKKNKVKQAVNCFNNALKGDHFTVDILLDAAISLYDMLLHAKTEDAPEIHRTAVQYLLSYIKKMPDDVNAHNYLGLLYKKTGNVKDSITHYKIALTINPDDANLLCNLGIAYLALKKPRRAIEVYLLPALKIKPADANILFNIGKSYEYVKDYKQASNYYQEALLSNPVFSECHERLAIVTKKATNPQDVN